MHTHKIQSATHSQSVSSPRFMHIGLQCTSLCDGCFFRLFFYSGNKNEEATNWQKSHVNFVKMLKLMSIFNHSKVCSGRQIHCLTFSFCLFSVRCRDIRLQFKRCISGELNRKFCCHSDNESIQFEW